MGRINLYIHYDTVSNYIMTRGVNLQKDDFAPEELPNNLILAEAPTNFGRFDVPTNFKILRGKDEVVRYMNYVNEEHLRMSNWIDFETIEMMHELTPEEIAELLYLFHSSMSLRSAFFYKLQNNYVYLTLPNGLNKVYYRHVNHFFARFARVMKEQMYDGINGNRSMLFQRRTPVTPFPLDEAEKLLSLFQNGLKIGFTQPQVMNDVWTIPLFIIEDDLTLLSRHQPQNEQVGTISYDVRAQSWLLNLDEY